MGTSLGVRDVQEQAAAVRRRVGYDVGICGVALAQHGNETNEAQHCVSDGKVGVGPSRSSQAHRGGQDCRLDEVRGKRRCLLPWGTLCLHSSKVSPHPFCLLGVGGKDINGLAESQVSTKSMGCIAGGVLGDGQEGIAESGESGREGDHAGSHWDRGRIDKAGNQQSESAVVGLVGGRLQHKPVRLAEVSGRNDVVQTHMVQRPEAGPVEPESPGRKASCGRSHR